MAPAVSEAELSLAPADGFSFSAQLIRPAAHRLTAKLNAGLIKQLLLTVQRQAIVHFAADDLGKQTRCGHAFRDNCWRHIGNFYLDLGAVGLTLPAAVFQPHVSKHPDLCWDELELLTDFLHPFDAAHGRSRYRFYRQYHG